jgi:hypothetical protein
VSEHLPESDWRHLRAVSALALDRYCAQVLEEAATIVRDTRASNHERYLRLFELIQDRDRTLARAFDDMRRSRAIERLAALIQLRLLTQEELAGFTEETVRSATI